MSKTLGVVSIEIVLLFLNGLYLALTVFSLKDWQLFYTYGVIILNMFYYIIQLQPGD